MPLVDLSPEAVRAVREARERHAAGTLRTRSLADILAELSPQDREALRIQPIQEVA
jgi:hypothetical protein